MTYRLMTYFTGCLPDIHKDIPLSPQFVHKLIHSGVLTALLASPSFALTGVPVLRAVRRFWGRGTNGPERSERLPALPLPCPGTPAVPAP
jgi:hypothetical protein